MAIITEKLQLNKKFLIIDSPVPFTLRANNGTDEVYRMAGAWQLDTDKLLPEKYMKQYPVFNLDLVYDDTNLNGQHVVVRESNIDIGDGISGVNGQDVRITNFNEMPSPVLPDNYPVTNELDSDNDKIPLKIEVDSFNIGDGEVSTLLNNINNIDTKFDNNISDIITAINNLKKKIYSIIGNKNPF